MLRRRPLLVVLILVAAALVLYFTNIGLFTKRVFDTQSIHIISVTPGEMMIHFEGYVEPEGWGFEECRSRVDHGEMTLQILCTRQFASRNRQSVSRFEFDYISEPTWDNQEDTSVLGTGINTIYLQGSDPQDRQIIWKK